MNRLKELLAAFFAPYERSGLVGGFLPCTTDEIAEAIVEAVIEKFTPIATGRPAQPPPSSPKSKKADKATDATA